MWPHHEQNITKTVRARREDRRVRRDDRQSPSRRLKARHDDCKRVGRWGRVNCSILSGLFGPMGLLRGGQDREAREEEDVMRLLELELFLDGGYSWWWCWWTWRSLWWWRFMVWWCPFVAGWGGSTRWWSPWVGTGGLDKLSSCGDKLRLSPSLSLALFESGVAASVEPTDPRLSRSLPVLSFPSEKRAHFFFLLKKEPNSPSVFLPNMVHSNLQAF